MDKIISFRANEHTLDDIDFIKRSLVLAGNDESTTTTIIRIALCLSLEHIQEFEQMYNTLEHLS